MWEINGGKGYDPRFGILRPAKPVVHKNSDDHPGCDDCKFAWGNFEGTDTYGQWCARSRIEETRCVKYEKVIKRKVETPLLTYL